MAKQKISSKKQQEVSAIEELIAVRQAFNSLEGQHQKRLYEELAKVYYTAGRLRADPDEWMSFCRHMEWANFSASPKNADQPDALRFAVRFAVGFPTGNDEKRAATKRANKLSGALQVLLEDKVPAADVVERLEERGVEDLNREKARRNKAPTVWTIMCPDEVSAKVLSALKVGERRIVALDAKSIDGLLIEAKVLRTIKKQKPTTSV